jgi:hypothetical protein
MQPSKARCSCVHNRQQLLLLLASISQLPPTPRTQCDLMSWA